MAWLGQRREQRQRCLCVGEREGSLFLSTRLLLCVCETSLLTFSPCAVNKKCSHLHVAKTPGTPPFALPSAQLLLELLENLIKMLAFFCARIDFYEFAKNSKWKQQQYHQKSSEYLQKYQTYVCVCVCGGVALRPATHTHTQSRATECRVHKSSARLSSVLIQLRICLIKI